MILLTLLKDSAVSSSNSNIRGSHVIISPDLPNLPKVSVRGPFLYFHLNDNDYTAKVSRFHQQRQCSRSVSEVPSRDNCWCVHSQRPHACARWQRPRREQRDKDSNNCHGLTSSSFVVNNVVSTSRRLFSLRLLALQCHGRSCPTWRSIPRR